MNTYLYEITFKKNGNQTYDHIRAANKEDAIIKLSKNLGDITIIGVSRIGH